MEDNLLDRLLRGYGEARIQRRILSETVLTYQQTITFTNSMGLAAIGTSHITGKLMQIHAIATTRRGDRVGQVGPLKKCCPDEIISSRKWKINPQTDRLNATIVTNQVWMN